MIQKEILMNRNTLFAIFGIALFISVFLAKQSIPGWYYNLGKTAYDKGDYKEAIVQFRHSLAYDKKNTNCRYYYIKALLNVPPTVKIQREIYDFSMEDINDSADLLADNRILEWRNAVMKNAGEN